MPVLFSDAHWAPRLAALIGGFGTAHVLHRVFAAIMIAVFVVHVGRLVARVAVQKDYSIFWGPSSMVPQPKDVQDMYRQIRWFLGLGPKPIFDRYTYWEKFDYWAVFWGMGIIGGSGLMLWFPVAFSHLVPGWVYQHRAARARRRGAARRRLHLHDSLLQRPPAAREVPDGHGHLHRPGLGARDEGRAAGRIRARDGEGPAARRRRRRRAARSSSVA